MFLSDQNIEAVELRMVKQRRGDEQAGPSGPGEGGRGSMGADATRYPV